MLDQTFSLTFIKPEPYRRLQVLCLNQETGQIRMIEEPIRYSHQLGRFLKAWTGNILSEWVIGWRDWSAQFQKTKEKSPTKPIDHGLSSFLPRRLTQQIVFDESSNPFQEKLSEYLEENGFVSALPKHRPRRALPPIPVRAGPAINTYQRFKPADSSQLSASVRKSLLRP